MNNNLQRRPAPADQLPPHAPEAEAGLIGCLIMDPAQLPAVLERLGEQQPFYEVQNQVIFEALRGLHSAGRPIDMLTLIQRLRDTDKLEQAGGQAYVSSTPDNFPSVAMGPAYLDIVWNKFVARLGIRGLIHTSSQIMAGGELSDSILAQVETQVQVLKKEKSRSSPTAPVELQRPYAFVEAYFNQWFRHKPEEYGYPLPFNFPFRIRPSEMTLFTGDSGAGKSSFISQICIVAGSAGARTCVASFEEPPEMQLWRMSRQPQGHRGAAGSPGCTGAELMSSFSSRNATRSYVLSLMAAEDRKERNRARREKRAQEKAKKNEQQPPAPPSAS